MLELNEKKIGPKICYSFGGFLIKNAEIYKIVVYEGKNRKFIVSAI